MLSIETEYQSISPADALKARARHFRKQAEILIQLADDAREEVILREARAADLDRLAAEFEYAAIQLKGKTLF